ncbi:MAG: peptidoglycan DD-metalloendopeptidase family protein [Chloroflexota bacterium]
MSVNLSIRPRRRRARGFLGLAAALLVLLGLAGWQQGWWSPSQALANLGKTKLSQIPMTQPDVSPWPAKAKSAGSPAVVLAAAKVIEHPDSRAYTEALYAGEEQEIPWANAGGRTQVKIYTVQAGDTLWSIAAQFELDIDTLRWSNPDLERNPDVLAVGAELVILPVVGVYHRAEAGDHVETIAARYGVTEADITAYPPNALYPPYHLTPGEGVIVPFGRKDAALPRPSPAPESPLAWPVAGQVTGGFTPDHPALDIGGPYGSTIYAAAAGTVTFAGWLNEGYGYSVIIDHGQGRETWYNHLKGTLLQAGGYVERGAPIAEMGSTGHSSGPHVHFEMRINGQPVNPTDYLPPNPR